MSKFAIGTFSFINLTRAVSRPMQRLEREVRPGVDGVSFWRTGVRAEPFQALSVVECKSVAAALELLAKYEALVGGDPVNVVWASVTLQNLQAIVHDVQPLEGGLHSMLLGIGGVSGEASFGLLRCMWTLESRDLNLSQ